MITILQPVNPEFMASIGRGEIAAIRGKKRCLLHGGKSSLAFLPSLKTGACRRSGCTINVKRRELTIDNGAANKIHRRIYYLPGIFGVHKEEKSPAIRGKKRCRLHGGKSTGPPKGNKNALRHGLYTREAKERRKKERKILREFLKSLSKWTG
ncbi:hypothetical protein EPN96_01865 [bacterium]|nr:MAG: hypothetical protein EPN96_01865 [bacterium]